MGKRRKGKGRKGREGKGKGNGREREGKGEGKGKSETSILKEGFWLNQSENGKYNLIPFEFTRI